MDSEITPSRSHILELLSKKFETPKENIKIRGIRGNFGIKNFTIEANIYNSREEKDVVELKKKKEGVVKAEAKKEPRQAGPAPEVAKQ